MFKQFQENYTPRSAMVDFMQANQSSIETPANFFKFPDNKKVPASTSDLGSYNAEASNRSNDEKVDYYSTVYDDERAYRKEENTVSLSDVSDNSQVQSSRKRVRNRNAVTLDDVDIDKDITN